MGILYLVSTPIGNLEDISVRAVRTIFTSDLLLCEDTRRTGMLLSEIYNRFAMILEPIPGQKKPEMRRFDNHTEQQMTPEIIGILEKGVTVTLVSDAGTPLLSDPGYYLVRECRKRGISVSAIPGPSALLTALTLSGFPMNTFCFLGYPPEKSSHRLQYLIDLKTSSFINDKTATVIFYAAPHKLETFLTDIRTIFGDIPVCIARELTKIHETVWQGQISEAIQTIDTFKGEIVVLFQLAH